MAETAQSGALYLVATPIGNLGDMSDRARWILSSVDRIAAEDTRHTGMLLKHFGIEKPLLSYHQHNEIERAAHLLRYLQAGESIALVSDAGTPGLSDPGYEITQICIREGITIVPIPGPVAAIAALIASGLPTDRFVFEGFLPSQKQARLNHLQTLKSEQRTLIFYEAPHRLMDVLRDMHLSWGDRPACAARELTKRFESFVRGNLSDVISHFEGQEPRGEFVLIVGGATENENADEVLDWRSLAQSWIDQGLGLKEVSARVAQATGRSRREVYQDLVQWGKEPL